MLLHGCCTHLPQTGEQDEHSQGPNGCSFHLMVLAVGQSQQHGDAHQLRLFLQSDTACQKSRRPRKKKRKKRNHIEFLQKQRCELTGSCAKACGGMVESASQVLICSLGFCSFCKALFRGPLKTSDQNVTTCVTTVHPKERRSYFSASTGCVFMPSAKELPRK